MVTNYLVTFLQVILQMSLTLTVPLYWQAVEKASTAQTGLYLIPAFVGNTIGGLFSGWWIRRAGRFKLPTVLGPVLGIICMVLCLLFWNGSGGAWKSTFIFFGGSGMGVISSSAFVGLAASVPEEDVAVAGSGMYLCVNIAGVAGTAAGSAVYGTALRKNLQAVLTGVDHGSQVRSLRALFHTGMGSLMYLLQIVKRLLEDMDYLLALDDGMWKRVVPAYVGAFHATNGRSRPPQRIPNLSTKRGAVLGLAATGTSLVIAALTRGKQLAK